MAASPRTTCSSRGCFRSCCSVSTQESRLSLLFCVIDTLYVTNFSRIETIVGDGDGDGIGDGNGICDGAGVCDGE